MPGAGDELDPVIEFCPNLVESLDLHRFSVGTKLAGTAGGAVIAGAVATTEHDSDLLSLDFDNGAIFFNHTLPFVAAIV